MSNPLVGFRTVVIGAATLFFAGMILMAVMDELGGASPQVNQVADSVKASWQLVGLVALLALPTVMKYWGTVYLVSYMIGTIFVLLIGFIDLLEFFVTNAVGIILLASRFGGD